MTAEQAFHQGDTTPPRVGVLQPPPDTTAIVMPRRHFAIAPWLTTNLLLFHSRRRLIDNRFSVNRDCVSAQDGEFRFRCDEDANWSIVDVRGFNDVPVLERCCFRQASDIVPNRLKCDTCPLVRVHALKPNGLNVHARSVAEINDFAEANCVSEHKRTTKDDVSAPDDARTDNVVESKW